MTDASDDGVRETRFEILKFDYDFEVSTSVTFENDSVVITGIILGNNTCYTARIDEVSITNHCLLVSVESYENSDNGCRAAEIGINYEMVVEFNGEPPAEVTVKHNGEHVTTEQPS